MNDNGLFERNSKLPSKIYSDKLREINAIKRLNTNEYINNPIKLEDMKEYFKMIKDKYKMLSYLDISMYATNMINKLI